MLKKSLHIILAFLLLISTSGFSINMHFCQNEMRDLQMFCQARSCNELSQKTKACHKTPVEETKACKKGCCQDKSDFHKLDLDLQITSNQLNSLNFNTLAAILLVVLNIDIPSLDKKSTDYFNYKPPLIVCDFTAELQTFLL